MIVITSDHHFFHTKIIEYAERPFDNAIEMNEYMIAKWNSVVSDQDTVYHLGDFSFGGREKITGIINRLNGRIILIKGNHDNRKSDSWWKSVGISDVIDGGVILKDFFLLSHKPMFMNSHMPYCNIHGHIHNNKMESDQYYNICVEHHDYTPIRLDYIIELLREQEE